MTSQEPGLCITNTPAPLPEIESIFKTKGLPVEIEPNRKQRRAQKAETRALKNLVSRIKNSSSYKKKKK